MEPDVIESIFVESIYSIHSKPAVVIDQEWSKIKPEDIELLTKILNAIGQKLDGVTINYQANLDLNLLFGKPLQVIYFGKPVTGIALYDVIETPGIKLVASDRLEDLLKNDEAKKKLWQALKKQFFA